MILQQHDFATRLTVVRVAIEAYQSWIEARLAVPLSETVIFESRLDLSQIAIEKVLGCSSSQEQGSRATRRLSPLVTGASTPEGVPPILTISKALAVPRDICAALGGMEHHAPSHLKWEDCPIALELQRLTAPVVVLNVPYQSGPASFAESVCHLVVARRDRTQEIIRLFGELDARDSRATLHTLNGSTRAVSRCGWNDLILDANATSLLRDDFEAFWEKEAWFREKKIPWRRGYLLHGPPGNGKSTAVRTMMSTRGLPAFTLRLFAEHTSDSDLDELFDAALREAPAMILLEDLDRAFPRDGNSGTRVSLQYLLNCLDGVATGEGLVVVATANEPTLLDPAILRRPGRFDRVVQFPNPGSLLRCRYFCHLNSAFRAGQLDVAVSMSEGFSFAQLREAYILAAQAAFRRNDEIRLTDLLTGICRLRNTIQLGSARAAQAGFFQPPKTEAPQLSEAF